MSKASMCLLQAAFGIGAWKYMTFPGLVLMRICSSLRIGKGAALRGILKWNTYIGEEAVTGEAYSGSDDFPGSS